ncbi:hypothetical protein, partial [Leifsonia sp. SIMBA_070]|uniref:hypothetical protein n=1 Tax=Leifsonia sp. SIMBA_070 TaxID=3085810 RepID=UPI00397C90B3
MELSEQLSRMPAAEEQDNPVIRLLSDYVVGTTNGVDEQIETFLTTGRVPMPGGVELPWRVSEKIP